MPRFFRGNPATDDITWSSPGFAPSSDYSIFFSFRAYNTGAFDHNVINHADATSPNGRGWRIWIWSSGELRFSHYYSVGSRDDLASPNMIRVDEFYHCGFVSVGGRRFIWVNGLLVAEANNAVWTAPQTTDPIRFAGNVTSDTAGHARVRGTFQNLAYWDRALGATELEQVASISPLVCPAGLKFFVPLSGGSVRDEIGGLVGVNGGTVNDWTTTELNYRPEWAHRYLPHLAVGGAARLVGQESVVGATGLVRGGV